MAHSQNAQIAIVLKMGAAAAAFWIISAISTPQGSAADPSKNKAASALPHAKQSPALEEIIEQRERTDKALDESDQAQRLVTAMEAEMGDG